MGGRSFARRTLAAIGALTLALWAGAAVARGGDDDGGSFGDFEPLTSSAACTPGGNPTQPFVLPVGFSQQVFAKEGDGGTIDLWDMNTQNETGARKGRYLYRAHETAPSQVSVTDLRTGVTKTIAQRADWERFDGIAWTPWGTLLVAEEVVTAAVPDPEVPQAKAGLLYELFIDPKDPTKLDLSKGGGDGIAPRPAVGSRSHEGIRLDDEGNLYGISEASPPTGGYIYRFTPDKKGDLSSGELFALRITEPDGDRTGGATWILLDPTAVQASSDSDATARGATGYGRPEDVETDEITGRKDPLGNTLYVAITSEDRVLGVRLGGGGGDDDDDDDGGSDDRAFVSDYVKVGLNAPADFDSPDNLALDHEGNLFITEDPGTASTTGRGDDIWAAFPPRGDDDDDDGDAPGAQAERTVRFASLTDCNAEPTGIYFDIQNELLYVNAQHRGGDGLDLGVRISPPEGGDDDH